MTGMWLVCLSLLVAADAASIGSKPVDIPVQVVYDDALQARQLGSLKNLEEKPQLSTEEKVEADVLHIPEVIARIAQPVQNEKVENEDSSSSSSQSFESSEENNLSENKSGEDAREQESNEIDSNNIDNLKLKLVAPESVEEIEVAEVAAVPIEEAVILEAEAPQVKEVVPEVQEVQAVPEIQEIPAIPAVQEALPEIQVHSEDEKIVESVQQENVEDVPAQEGQDSNYLRQGSSTSAPPNRPILGLINRLSETVGNAINSIRPQNPSSSTTQLPVVPAEVNPQDTKVQIVSEEGLPIAAATAEEETTDASESSQSSVPPANPTNPTVVGSLQQNINNQLNNFGNRVNTFINNLRPKQPEGTQSEEEPVTPNTPVINNIQHQFNNGLHGFIHSVNNTFDFLSQNNRQQNVTQIQSDETSEKPPQNNNPIIQTFLNGALNFQQSFSSLINGQNQNPQQGDEASPNNSTNIGQQILQVFQNGISNIVQNFRPNNTGTQSDEAAPSQPTNPITGFQNFIGNINQQFTNLITGGAQPNNTGVQGISSQLPGGGQGTNLPSGLPSLPAVPSLPGVPSLPAVPSLPSVPSIPGVPSLPSVPSIPGVPALPEVPSFAGIPSLPGLPALPEIPSIPGVPSIPEVGSIPGAPSISASPVTDAAVVSPTVPAA